MTNVTPSDIKAEILERVTELFLEHERVIQPTKPFIFIRVLPREQYKGHIYLPQKQNKPNIEAVVMAVYEPYWERVDKIDEDGKRYDISVYNECDVKVGDHILFPHFVGLPDKILDEEEYRFIREDDAFAVVTYRHKNWLKDDLQQRLTKAQGKTMDSVITELLDTYDFVPKRMGSVTLSGK